MAAGSGVSGLGTKRTCTNIMVNIAQGEVLIFKALNDDCENNSEDPYSKKLEESGLITRIIPVLHFEYCNLECLQERLLTPLKYSGIIFTSPRAVKATALCLGPRPNLPVEWHDHPAFVVGEGTHRALERELGLKGEGCDSGSAASLADFILRGTYEGPLLFPCGNLKRDVLPSKLAEGGVQLDMVTVYQTKPHTCLEENLVEATARGTRIPEFLIYFSPSGVKSTVPFLKKLLMPLDQLKIVAIGPTTEGAVEEFQLPLWSRATKPTPEYLVNAVLGKA